MKTFPAPEVRSLIDRHFVFVELDIEEHEAAAEWLDVSAIPDAVILALDGSVVDRRRGFVEPSGFAAWLRGCVE